MRVQGIQTITAQIVLRGSTSRLVSRLRPNPLGNLQRSPYSLTRLRGLPPGGGGREGWKEKDGWQRVGEEWRRKVGREQAGRKNRWRRGRWERMSRHREGKGGEGLCTKDSSKKARVLDPR